VVIAARSPLAQRGAVKSTAAHAVAATAARVTHTALGNLKSRAQRQSESTPPGTISAAKGSIPMTYMLGR
jgi:hypothetical protein